MTSDEREELRRRYGSAPEFLRHEDALAIIAALADADALDDALTEIRRLREALSRIVVVAAKGDAELACSIAFIAGCSPEMRIGLERCAAQ